MLNPKLVQVAQEAIEEARSEGLDEEDTLWMAIGAVEREGRNQGIIGAQIDAEMNAAIIALVKQELAK